MVREAGLATAKMIAPLRGVESVSATGRKGLEIGPHHMWCEAEFDVTLECGHSFRIVRFHDDGSCCRLEKPMPRRVRCKECDQVPSKGRPRPQVPDPEYDPVVAALVTAACRADSDHEHELLDWISRHGRFVADQAAREHAYRCLVLALVDLYVHDAHPQKAPAAREHIHRWVVDPSEENQAQARKHVRRLYDAQHNAGEWFANRGFIATASAMSPRSRVRGLLDAITWDSETRAPFYADLSAKRAVLDATAIVGTDAEFDLARDELDRAMLESWPTIEASHVPIVKELLFIYQREVGEAH